MRGQVADVLPQGGDCLRNVARNSLKQPLSLWYPQDRVGIELVRVLGTLFYLPGITTLLDLVAIHSSTSIQRSCGTGKRV
jgi:hypothetical protein